MSFFRKKSLFVILIRVILLVVLVSYSITDRDQLSKPEKFFMDSVGWVQSVINKPVSYTVNMFNSVGEIKNTYDEKKVLRVKLAVFKTLIYDVKTIYKEIEDLHEVVEYERLSLVFVLYLSSFLLC